jgi:uncharacterized protein (DUF952 family)
MTLIYKILSRAEWDAAEAAGRSRARPSIWPTASSTCRARHQAQETAALYGSRART